MPIITPSDLPVNTRLKRAGISVISQDEAEHQDIGPLQMAVLNLMPDKREAEYQLLRLIGSTSLQIEMTLMHTASHKSKNTSPEYLARFSKSLESVSQRKFHGIFITGAPVEEKPFEDVDYWPELQDVMNWAREEVYARFYICWGAQAALHHKYPSIEKYPLAKKASGIYMHTATDPQHPLMQGFDDRFPVPVSRHTEIRRTDVDEINELDIVAESTQTGLYLVQSKDGKDTYCFNHPEYDTLTLHQEYTRDVERFERETMEGKPNPKPVRLPYNYYPFSDPGREPSNNWRSHGQTLYRNWIHSVYAALSLQRNQFTETNGTQEPEFYI